MSKKKVETKGQTEVKPTRKSRDREVTLADGLVVTMRPLPMNRIPEVLDSFFQVLALQSQGLTPLQIMMVAMDSVLTLLKECIITEVTDLTLDAADAPFVLNTFFDQNMNEATQMQWRSLIPRFTAMFPEMKAKFAEIEAQFTQK